MKTAYKTMQKIWTTNTNGAYEDCCFAEYDAVMSVRIVPTFRRYVFSPLSRQKIMV